MSPEDTRAPRAIRRRSDGIEIDWADGTQWVAWRALRLGCPCAACVDEMTSRPLLDPATIPADVHADALELVGGYGLRVRWSDGHSAGIYTFESLRDRGEPG